VAAQVERGARLEEAQRDVTLDDWKGWAGHDRLQPANVRRQFLSAEGQWTRGATP
jgi:hypothetical protein